METNPSPTHKLQNDVDTIRAILFGDQIQNFRERISALEKMVAELQEENKKLGTALENEAHTREARDAEGKASLESTKSDILGQLSQLDSRSTTDREKFEQALQAQKNNTASELQVLREEFVATVQAHQLKQDALIDAIAKALLAYQNGN